MPIAVETNSIPLFEDNNNWSGYAYKTISDIQPHYLLNR